MEPLKRSLRQTIQSISLKSLLLKESGLSNVKRQRLARLLPPFRCSVFLFPLSVRIFFSCSTVTQYYHRIFYAFYCPNMLKWRSTGTISCALMKTLMKFWLSFYAKTWVVFKWKDLFSYVYQLNRESEYQSLWGWHLLHPSWKVLLKGRWIDYSFGVLSI